MLGDTVVKVDVLDEVTKPPVDVTLRYHWIVEAVGKVFAGTFRLLVDPLTLTWLYVDVPETRQ